MMTVNEVLTLENQQEKIGALLLHGYRFVTMTVVDKGEEFDIFYHFDLDYDMVEKTFYNTACSCRSRHRRLCKGSREART